MAKVVHVKTLQFKTGEKAGKDYYILTLEGNDLQAISYEFVKLGDEIPDDKLKLNDKKDMYFIISSKGNSGGSSYRSQGMAKDQENIMAQVVFKAIIELAGIGKIDMFDKQGAYRQIYLANLGSEMAATIRGISTYIKDVSTLAEKTAPSNGDKKAPAPVT